MAQLRTCTVTARSEGSWPNSNAVAELAVYAAITTGALRGAAIDVFAEEPPFSLPLY